MAAPSVQAQLLKYTLIVWPVPVKKADAVHSDDEAVTRPELSWLNVARFAAPMVRNAPAIVHTEALPAQTAPFE